MELWNAILVYNLLVILLPRNCGIGRGTGIRGLMRGVATLPQR